MKSHIKEDHKLSGFLAARKMVYKIINMGKDIYLYQLEFYFLDFFFHTVTPLFQITDRLRDSLQKFNDV